MEQKSSADTHTNFCSITPVTLAHSASTVPPFRIQNAVPKHTGPEWEICKAIQAPLIHLVRHSGNDRLAVLKSDPAEISTPQDEAAILKTLHHPNIVQFIDDFYDADFVGAELFSQGFYMEYCDSGSFANMIDWYIKQGQIIPEPFMWHIFESLVSAIDYMHTNQGNSEEGSVCEDLSTPATPYPRVVLADFDCAVTEKESVEQGFSLPEYACGYMIQDPDFAPPEATCVCRFGDIYQVGLIMHCLGVLTKVPFITRSHPIESFEKGRPDKLSNGVLTSGFNKQQLERVTLIT